MLVTEDLRIEYPTKEGPVVAVNDISFTLASGEFFTLLGPSGCGKTSTLRAVAGLEKPTGGRIQIGNLTVFESSRGVNLSTHKRQIGMGFQSYAIWPHMTVIQNVAFPLRRGRSRMNRADADRRAREALDLVRLAHLSERRATDLSGGQQQRVALARALVREPDLLLLDEPLSNLDAKLREDMRREITDVVTRIGMTTLYVTHDQTEALSMSDRVAVMCDGEVAQLGSPRELYLYPKDEFVANFVGRNNIMHGQVIETRPGSSDFGLDFSEVDVETENGWGLIRGFSRERFPVGTPVTVSFRPEAVQFAATDSVGEATLNQIDGRVELVTFLGDCVEYTVETDAGLYCVKSDPYVARFGEGEGVVLRLPRERCVVLPRTDGRPSSEPAVPSEADPGDEANSEKEYVA